MPALDSAERFDPKKTLKLYFPQNKKAKQVYLFRAGATFSFTFFKIVLCMCEGFREKPIVNVQNSFLKKMLFSFYSWF